MNEITLYERIEAPVDAISKLGEVFARSGMFGCEKIEQGQIMAMQCMSERISPLDLARKYHIINGKLSMRADAMLAEFRARGGKIQWVKTDATEARAKFLFEGNEIEIAFTAADATQAGFLPAKPGSGWAKFPDAMLRARLTSKAMRMLCPEAVVGLYTPEEVEDFGDTPKPGFRQTLPATNVVDSATVPEQDKAADELAAAMGDQPKDDPASDDQRKKIFAMMKAGGVNMENKAVVLSSISLIIGREIASTKDMTKPEASRVIEYLNQQMEKKEVAA